MSWLLLIIFNLHSIITLAAGYKMENNQFQTMGGGEQFALELQVDYRDTVGGEAVTTKPSLHYSDTDGIAAGHLESVIIDGLHPRPDYAQVCAILRIFVYILMVNYRNFLKVYESSNIFSLSVSK